MKFKSDIEVQAGLKDSSGSAGTSGKILSSTGTGVAWVDDNPGISGSGTVNYVSKFTGSTTLGNSLLFDNGTNVGIGTTTLSEKLSVAGNVFINSLNATLELGNGGGGKYGSIAFNNSTNDVEIKQKYASGGIIFNTNTSSERMRITSAGNVGIGTSSPSQKLDVNGGNVLITSAAPYISLKTTQTGTPDWKLYNSYNAIGDFAIVGGTSVDNKFNIQPSGNVGIGTTSPTYRLDVSTPNINTFRTKNTTAASGNTINIHNDSNLGLNTTVYGSAYSAGSWLSLGVNGVALHSNSTANFGILTTTNTSLLFGTNAGERMRITSDGNVGIGTTSPDQKLVISGASNIYSKIVTSGVDSTLGINLVNDARSWVIRVDGADGDKFQIRDASAGAQRVTIDTSGNVGIGTTAPSIKLQVETSVNGSDGIWARNTNTGTSAFGSINCVSGVGAINLRAHSAAHSVWANTSMINSASAFTGGMVLFQDGANPISLWTNGSERMRINAAGNLLIGATADISSSRREIVVRGANGSLLSLGNNTNADRLQIVSDSGENALINNKANTPMILYTNNVERMRITNGGNVGIGASNPLAKLDIVTPPTGFNRGMKIGPQTATDGDGTYIEFTASSTDGFGPQIGGIRSGAGGLGDLIIRTGGNTQTERFRVTNAGNVGIGTSSPGAKLDVNGDALINGLTVGRGAGNSAYNTAFGVGALSSNTSGEYNLAIGRNANFDVNISGSTVIGTDLFTSPGNSSLTSNCLAISQHNPSNSGTQYPHIYAPDKVNCPNGNVTTDVLAVDYSVYTAVFMEYSIFNSAGDQFRAGTYTAAFKGTGTVVEDDNQTVVYSGTTLAATFTTSVTGSVVTIQLRNQDSDTYDIRVTARLLMR